jgi:hypothetical protein
MLSDVERVFAESERQRRAEQRAIDVQCAAGRERLAQEIDALKQLRRLIESLDQTDYLLEWMAE